MKLTFKNYFFAIPVLALMLGSCETTRQMSKQDKGVAAGVILGGIAGGVIGNNTGKGNTAAGAIIGAAVGGAAGGIIGAKMDRQAEKIKTEIPGAKVERIAEGIDVTFDDNADGSAGGIYFATEKSDLNANSINALNKLVKIFAEYPDTDIMIEGHTDDTGRDEYNLSLSQRRAEAVANYLRNAGVLSTRLTTKWYGESKPKVENSSAENRALNRRVQIIITANEKMKQQAEQEAGSN